jgi:ABC-2 type transport system ATP-binding protein
LRVRELFALLTNIHPNFSQEKARQFLEGTDVKMEARIKHLSKGMIAQLHLAVVMAIDAKLLVLDEPTLGLDITYRKRFYRRLLEDYMTEERTLLITTHQVDEIEFMLSDIMFIRDGELILHMQMETVSGKYAQVLVRPADVETARALGPIYEETRFGQTAMVFDGVERERLAQFGDVSTPTLSDLFVALMQREPK